jgi:hypothetical protein
LNYEPDLGGCTEIPHNQKRYDLQKGIPGKRLFVLSYLLKLIKPNGCYLHDVADIQILDPLGLIQEPKDMTEVYLMLILQLIFFLFATTLSA